MSPRTTDRQRTAAGLFIFLGIIICLYWAKAVLIPVALSVLLTFLLAPVVTRLERLRLPRVAAVLTVVVLVFSVLLAAGWVITVQLTSLGRDIGSDDYQKNIKAKLETLSWVEKSIDRLQKRFKKASEEAKEAAKEKEGEPPADPDEPGTKAPDPLPVIVHAEQVTGFMMLPAVLGTLGEPIAMAGLVITLVIFMLIAREDLRNRLIRLIGYGRLTDTTRALDDAGERISRYLVAQTIINGTFGIGVGIGLYFFGVPYALLWGFLSAILRFIPYVGPLIAAVFPLTFSLFVFKGWGQPLLITGFYLILELVSNMGMEPLLYGRSAGVSQVAILISIAFWTWLWGPIGLLLATPLTVCFVVLGRYVPQLEFIGIVLGDEPVLDANIIYYQRLVAMDQDEALEIVDEYLETSPLDKVYDDLLIPALVFAGKDRRQDRISPEDEKFILEATRDILEEVKAREAKARKDRKAEDLPAAPADGPIVILGCPARGEMDELAIQMLVHVLDSHRYSMKVLSPTLLASELVAACSEAKPDILFIGSLPPGGLAQSRYLLKKMQANCQGSKILVGRWGLKANPERNVSTLEAVGAEQVGLTLLESRAQIDQQAPLIEKKAPGRAQVGAPAETRGDRGATSNRQAAI